MMKSENNVNSVMNCIGCMVCTQSCPENAITMHRNEEGFYMPGINEELCNACGGCLNVCPQINKPVSRDYLRSKDIYAAWDKDIEIRKSSSSGGIFSSLARWCLLNDGYVVGAAYDEDFMVRHIIIDNAEEMYKLHGSKYVQSDTNGIWSAIADIIETKKPVLFSGTPCQVNGLYHYLGKDYDNLYTVDLVCHGTPSPMIWQDYLATIKRVWKSEIIDINLRHKGVFGWSQRKILIGFGDGRAYISDKGSDYYCRLFLENYILKPSCYECKYASMNRIADITLGDFWGFKPDNDTKDNNDTGYSAVIVNTPKGKSLFDDISGEIECIPRNEAEVVRRNPPLHTCSKPNPDRDVFWRDYHIWGLSFAIRKTFSDRDENGRNRYLFSMFRKWLILKNQKVEINDILKHFNISNIMIYGIGDVGMQIYNQLQSGEMVRAFIDRSYEQYTDGIDNISVLDINNASDFDDPILITPAYYFQTIADNLIEAGINPRRLISFPLLLRWYDLDLNIGKARLNTSNKMEHVFLITGAQFHNKGAQSMLYVAVDEIKKRFPNALIYYYPIDNHPAYSVESREKYRFLFLLSKDRPNSELYEILPLLTAIIDVSGYALSSDWHSEWYLHILRMAKQYQVPIYLMPQSYGPFDFDDRLAEELQGLLTYPSVIYARERSAYDFLRLEYKLKNVRYSEDIVLRSRGVNIENIYKEPLPIDGVSLLTENNVGIIPNVRNLEYGQKDRIMQVYESVINLLLKKNKHIYIVSHSNDMVACKEIFEMFKDHNHVHLLEKELECLEYGELVQSFEYIVASRYHSIVHAYKHAIPGIILGWAEKYHELARIFGQEDYLFDVRALASFNDILDAVDRIDRLRGEEQEKISKALVRLEENNCFDFLEELK